MATVTIPASIPAAGADLRRAVSGCGRAAVGDASADSGVGTAVCGMRRRFIPVRMAAQGKVTVGQCGGGDRHVDDGIRGICLRRPRSVGTDRHGARARRHLHADAVRIGAVCQDDDPERRNNRYLAASWIWHAALLALACAVPGGTLPLPIIATALLLRAVAMPLLGRRIRIKPIAVGLLEMVFSVTVCVYAPFCAPWIVVAIAF